MWTVLHLLICILAAVVLYGTGQALLFWLAVAAALSIIFYEISIFCMVTNTAKRRHRKEVEQMRLDRVSQEKFDAYNEGGVELRAEDYEALPRWIPFIMLIAAALGIILLISGLIIRLTGW